MDIQKHEIHVVPPQIVVQALTALTALLVVFALWGAMQVFTSIKEYRFIGSGTTATNTITVSGEGEVFAVPDIATFSITIQEEAKDVATAQDAATKNTNDVVAYLTGADIEEKDIKTTGYNVYPKYEWQQVQCVRYPCPEGEQTLVGYTVSQTIDVKVRDTDKAGEILSGVGSRGVDNVSGLSFLIDDPDELQSDAREKAIEDAEAKAKELAKQLGVDLVRIVGFTESGNGYYPPVAYMKRETMAVAMDSAMGGAVAPELPVGENKVQSNVTITYEIR